MPTYNNYVLHKPYEGAADRVYKAKTFIIGNIDSVNIGIHISPNFLYPKNIFISYYYYLLLLLSYYYILLL